MLPDSLRVLLVDENTLTRSVLASMLRSFGVQFIVQAARPEDARKRLRAAAQPFDVIICDYHFEGGQSTLTGQDLLDELRQSRGLPMNTAFLMVTDERRRHLVAESLEGALDDYLLKPLSAKVFEERLNKVLSRKWALKQVFTHIEAEEYEQAAQCCQEIFDRKGAHWLYAARIGSELYLRLKAFTKAKAMYESIIEEKAVPWARLGLAKVQLEVNGPIPAMRILESLLAEHPTYLDAYDVMARAYIEESDLEAALSTYEQALKLGPFNVFRLQKAGVLAFYLGQYPLAQKHLSRAVQVGTGAKTFDFQTLVLLNALATQGLESKTESERAQHNFEGALKEWPNSNRLRTFDAYLQALSELKAGRRAKALERLKEPAAELEAESFDFESALLLLRVCAYACEGEHFSADAADWVRALTLRFSTSRTTTRWLLAACSPCEALSEVMVQANRELNERSRQAMAYAVHKDYSASLKALLELAVETANARVQASAKAFAQRHRGHLDTVLLRHPVLLAQT